MAVYAIGDVQGCDDELGELLQRIAFRADRDRLWFTGDIVNRGPRSLAALRRVKAFGDNAIVVLGNHDLHLLAVARSTGRRKRADTLDEILAAPDRDVLLAWLESRPLLHHDGELGAALVHAGLPPQWDIETAGRAAREVERALAHDPRTLYRNMYGDEPDTWSDSLSGYDRLRFTVNCLTRLRYCTPEGRIRLDLKDKPSKAPAPYIPWFRVPGRRSADVRIVCGHWSALGLHLDDNVLAIDTGCVWGGKLCSLRIDTAAEPVLLGCPQRLKPSAGA
jgi:bis(5'-nucleosyl)-tetraphosphatase (symmetrical)